MTDMVRDHRGLLAGIVVAFLVNETVRLDSEAWLLEWPD